MQRSIAVFVLLGYPALRGNENARDACVSVSRSCMQRSVAVVVLDVWVAAGQQQLATGLVVAVLTAEVESGETAGVGFGKSGSGGGQ